MGSQGTESQESSAQLPSMELTNMSKVGMLELTPRFFLLPGSIYVQFIQREWLKIFTYFGDTAEEGAGRRERGACEYSSLNY